MMVFLAVQLTGMQRQLVANMSFHYFSLLLQIVLLAWGKSQRDMEVVRKILQQVTAVVLVGKPPQVPTPCCIGTSEGMLQHGTAGGGKAFSVLLLSVTAQGSTKLCLHH